MQQRHWGKAMKIKRIAALWFLAITAVWLSGCASPGQPASNGSAAANEQPEYVIGPGDKLQIYVRDNPDLSVTLPVRPDGRISVPMVQDVQAAGKTPAALAHDLENRLSQYVRTPTVTVMVMDFVGTYSDQVRIVGEAVQPRAIAYRQGMTLLDAIIEVGGLTRFAAGNSAKLIRRTDGGNRTIHVRLDDLVNGGDISANVPLRPGDVLIIPESFL